MKIEYSDAVIRSLNKTPVAVRKAFFKQIGFLSDNLHHPSLRAKKYETAGRLGSTIIGVSISVSQAIRIES
jgi:hypothetical protein